MKISKHSSIKDITRPWRAIVGDCCLYLDLVECLFEVSETGIAENALVDPQASDIPTVLHDLMDSQRQLTAYVNRLRPTAVSLLPGA